MSNSPNQMLARFLGSPDRPEGTLGYHEVQGFLFAIACAPELVKPSEWLPLIFNEEDAQYASMEEAKSVLWALMEMYNEINARVFEENVDMPDDLTLATRALDNVGETSNLGQWSQGFIMGHDWLVEIWDHYTPEELDNELGSSMMVLSFFSHRELAEAYHREVAGAADSSLEVFAEKLYSVFEEAMRSYAYLGRSIQVVLTGQTMPQQPYVRENRSARNDPCPCGSGKKYKQCCLH